MLYDTYFDDKQDYYERRIVPQSFSVFKEIYTNESHVFFTESAIKLNNLEFGASIKAAISVFGKPRYTIEDNNFSQTVYFYKEKINHHEVLIQLHFFQEKFICATQTINDSDAGWKALAHKTIIEKYTVNNTNDSHNTSESSHRQITICDNDENKIVIVNDFTLNVLYITGNKELLILAENFELQKKQKIVDDEKKLKEILLNKF